MGQVIMDEKPEYKTPKTTDHAIKFLAEAWLPGAMVPPKAAANMAIAAHAVPKRRIVRRPKNLWPRKMPNADPTILPVILYSCIAKGSLMPAC